MSWAIPAANQEWRVSVASRLAGINGARVTLSKGAAELTLGELRQHLDSVRGEGSSRRADALALNYHRRWALPCASFALALFALSAIPRQPVRRRTFVVAAAFAACVGYYVLMFVAELAAREGALTAAAAVWLPNLGLAVVSAALVLRRSRLPRASARA
jgi:lipopolysaccharide export system permease protein